MAPGAEPPDPREPRAASVPGTEAHDRPEGTGNGAGQLDAVLRVLEAVMFCCLSTLVVFWHADRLRGLDFEPIAVTPCVGAACTAYPGPSSLDPLAAYTETLTAGGPAVFSAVNTCARLVETLRQRGTEGAGVAQIMEMMSGRGTVTILGADAATLTIAPGPRNDDYLDVIRDGLSTAPSRGCHPLNYKPVFWPLFLGWALLASLRVFRNRQREWATR